LTIVRSFDQDKPQKKFTCGWEDYTIAHELTKTLLYHSIGLFKEIKRDNKRWNSDIERTNELAQSLISLKATQSQLIQSEKMASLGDLTAGIAHEIQNPLNLMNNFSEVNAELIDEVLDAIDAGNQNEALDLISNLKENELRITHHGQRADAIGKGMLQHSLSSSGAKEPTDINDLADEYLRLTYRGLRSNDNSFNAILNADFDESIGKIIAIPQDIEECC
jgi:two-component system NtrC family sensor kinase